MPEPAALIAMLEEVALRVMRESRDSFVGPSRSVLAEGVYLVVVDVRATDFEGCLFSSPPVPVRATIERDSAGEPFNTFAVDWTYDEEARA